MAYCMSTNAQCIRKLHVLCYQRAKNTQLQLKRTPNEMQFSLSDNLIFYCEISV